MICGVRPGARPLLLGCALLAAACVLAACGNSPARPDTAPTTTTSSTTTTTTAPPATTTTTTLPAGVGVPNVIGMKIDLARIYLRTAGFTTVPLNMPCNKGSLPSQSVVASLSIPGRPPDVTVGAQPLAPGTLLPKASRVGITWSGCYPAGTTVPEVTGHTFFSAVHLLHLAGLTWACYSVGEPTTTTTRPRTTTTRPVTTGTVEPTSTTTTAPSATETATLPPTTVLMQGTKAGTLVPAGAVVALIMHHCPQ
jgi:beta-lactam-binding protein with PASTA domain